MDRSMHTTCALLTAILLLYLYSREHDITGEHLLIVIMLFAGMNLPDLDTSKLLKHRRTMHSLFTSVVLFIVVFLTAFTYPEIRIYLYFIPIGVLLHICQDMATPSGCALFYPLAGKKYRYARLKGDGVGAAVLTVLISGAASVLIFEIFTRFRLF